MAKQTWVLSENYHSIESCDCDEIVVSSYESEEEAERALTNVMIGALSDVGSVVTSEQLFFIFLYDCTTTEMRNIKSAFDFEIQSASTDEQREAVLRSMCKHGSRFACGEVRELLSLSPRLRGDHSISAC
ncbi:hypothetical protein AB4254_08125 [Vibrio breoganii]